MFSFRKRSNYFFLPPRYITFHFLTNSLENIPLLFSKKKNVQNPVMACNYDADIRQRKFQNSEKRLPSLSDSFLFYDCPVYIHFSSSSDEISSKNVE